jgi:hypothetical protein
LVVGSVGFEVFFEQRVANPVYAANEPGCIEHLPDDVDQAGTHLPITRGNLPRACPDDFETKYIRTGPSSLDARTNPEVVKAVHDDVKWVDESRRGHYYAWITGPILLGMAGGALTVRRLAKLRTVELYQDAPQFYSERQAFADSPVGMITQGGNYADPFRERAQGELTQGTWTPPPGYQDPYRR